MKFNFDSRPDTSISYIDHNGKENTRFGSSVSMSTTAYTGGEVIGLSFKLRDELRPEYVSSEPTGSSVVVDIQLDSKMASLLASWIIQYVNSDDHRHRKLDFEDSKGEPLKLPIDVEV